MVKFNNLKKQWDIIKSDASKEFEHLFDNGSYILGPQVKIFEGNFAKYIGTKFAIGVSNGTDALRLCYESLELKGTIGIIIQANTYIATAFAARLAYPEAEIIFCDVDNTYELDINRLQDILKTKRVHWDHCIITPVHMFGATSDISGINYIAQKFSAFIIEDCSQAHGAECDNLKVGNIGIVNGFSCYPGKNLGAIGDAGVVTTNDEKVYEIIIKKRQLGSTVKFVHDVIGHNNRLDTIQAIVLNEKLKHLDNWNDSRIFFANKIKKEVQNSDITFLTTPNYCTKNVYHVFSVLTENKEHFQNYMKQNRIETNMHYPIPVEKTPMFKTNYINENTRYYCDHATSLPIHPFMNDDIDTIISTLNSYKYG